MPPSTLETHVPLSEAVALTGRSRGVIHQWREQERLPAVRVGHAFLYERETLLKLDAERPRHAAKP